MYTAQSVGVSSRGDEPGVAGCGEGSVGSVAAIYSDVMFCVSASGAVFDEVILYGAPTCDRRSANDLTKIVSQRPGSCPHKVVRGQIKTVPSLDPI